MSQLTAVNYSVDGKQFEGFYAEPTGLGKRPVILIFHAWRGCDQFVKEKALNLAQSGYFAYAVDLYGKGVLGKNEEECKQLMEPLIKNRDLIYLRAKHALQGILNHPKADLDRIGAIGFCFGGLSALDMARKMDGIKGVVSFHGLLNSSSAHFPIQAKILVLHGLKDPMVSQQDLIDFQQEMQRLKADFQIHIYGHAYHAFTNPIANDPSKGTVYDPVIAKRAFIAMENFFKEIFNE